MDRYFRTIFKLIVLGVLTSMLISCSPANTKGPGDFGGGDVNLHGVTAEQVQEEVSDVDKVKVQLFNSLKSIYKMKSMFPKEFESSFFGVDVKNEENKFKPLTEQQSSHLKRYLGAALDKLYTSEPTIDSVLKTNSLETWLDKPCKTTSGKEVDESYVGSDASKVCISGATLSKKLNNLNLSKAVFSIAMHGLAHKAGANENEARAVEYFSYAFPDTIVKDLKLDFITLERLEKDLSNLKMLVDEVKSFSESYFYEDTVEQLKTSYRYRGRDFEWLFKEENEIVGEIGKIEKTLSELNEELDTYDKSLQKQEIETLKAVIEAQKQLLGFFTQKLNGIQDIYKYITSGEIIVQFKTEFICNSISSISNINDYFSSKNFEFLFGEKERKLLFEIDARRAFTEIHFCSEIAVPGIAPELYLFLDPTKDARAYIERPKFVLGSGSWESDSKESVQSLKILYWLDDAGVEKKFEILRPSHRGDLLVTLNKMINSFNELRKLLKSTVVIEIGK